MEQNWILDRTKQFSAQLESMRFSCDCYIYNPLQYAWQMHQKYLSTFVSQPVRTLLVGMNPGPFGMAQTGIPFGEIEAVTSFLGIEAPIERPVIEHPKRPVEGLAVKRSEVSGKRLWSMIEEHYGDRDTFRSEMAVMNYCPLLFLDRGQTARNITPDKLVKMERMALEAICDSYLNDIVQWLKPSYVIGVGVYALSKLERVLADRTDLVVASILHPSPASPKANRGWAAQASATLEELGVW
jgi:single-strand selective monofunctional uracil DNA glycosylase